MTIAGILFDKDGTLLDFHASWVPVIRAAALLAAENDAGLAEALMERGGYEPASGRIRSGSPLAAETTAEIAALWAEVLPGWGAEALTTAMEAIFVTGGAEHAVPVTDLADLFRRFRARSLALGVATSDSHAGMLASLAGTGAIELLDFVAGCDTGHGNKPGPGPCEAFCRAVSLRPDQVAVVGDNLHDLEMGRSAGAALCVGVLTGTSTRDELAPHADHVIADITRLEALF